jgi:hypothetical protein
MTVFTFTDSEEAVTKTAEFLDAARTLLQGEGWLAQS